MELMPSADRVVREILPAAFDAGGSRDAASALRGLGPLSCHRSAGLAASALKSIRVRELRASSGVFRDAAFWCEKAVWAAACGDVAAFSRYVDAAHAAVREAMSGGGALN